MVEAPSSLARRPIRCILFDLGETLWTYDSLLYQEGEKAANQRAASVLRERLATRVLPETDITVLGYQIREAIGVQFHLMIREHPDYDPDPIVATREALCQLGFSGIQPALAQEVFEALRVRIPGSRRLFDDTLSTLAELKQRGFLLGVVTNRGWGGKPFLEDLEYLGLLNYLDPRHIAISADLRVRKPNPAIFHYALNALQVTPAETAMVGDSILADVAGAQALQLVAIWKPKSSHYQAYMRERRENLAGAAQGKHKEEISVPSSPSSLEREMIDDKLLLAYVRSHEAKLGLAPYSELRPDLTILHLHELLEIFPKVGKL